MHGNSLPGLVTGVSDNLKGEQESRHLRRILTTKAKAEEPPKTRERAVACRYGVPTTGSRDRDKEQTSTSRVELRTPMLPVPTKSATSVLRHIQAGKRLKVLSAHCRIGILVAALHIPVHTVGIRPVSFHGSP
jgi:hypothetical protein